MANNRLWSNAHEIRRRIAQQEHACMTPSQKKQDWLNWFRLAVTQARDARLAGDMPRAAHLDSTVEQYYRDAEEIGLTEDDLFPIESDIRNQ